MTTITARDASRGFSTLLDRVEHDGEEYTVERDGRVIARIVPATTRTVAGFLARRAGRLPLDDDFAAEATSANPLLTVDTADPWHA
ncbi:MAG: type II toxin-antitoxin system prevent-host-death family antitoxin [Tetrasphaera sp.]|jgi:prevent-host-death family protein|nr:type II toxin-antitoxin system prevent-host-death family antitoxin [Tetrasphaera sp.]